MLNSRHERARRDNQVWVTLPAEQGNLVLFESWLRHEVAPNPSEAERISVLDHSSIYGNGV